MEFLPSYHWMPCRIDLASLRLSVCDSDCFLWFSSRSFRAHSQDVTQTAQQPGLQWMTISEYRPNLSFQLSSSEVVEGSWSFHLYHWITCFDVYCDLGQVFERLPLCLPAFDTCSSPSCYAISLWQQVELKSRVLPWQVARQCWQRHHL